MSEPKCKKRIAFIHPDLGIGGAERLIVDAGVGLQDLGHDIVIYTSHCDKSHCFEEVSSGKLTVEVFGDFLPTSLFHKFHILFAILRQLYMTLMLIVSGQILKYDFIIVDQLSFSIPLLNVFCSKETRILFYCHFPDQLLVQQGGILKKIYRILFDLAEEWTTGCSDSVVVNSKFTQGIFYKTFTHLSHLHTDVIYPCIDVSSVEDNASNDIHGSLFVDKFFISVNRFERKKNVALAIKSYNILTKKLNPDNNKEIKFPRLVIAGGYDQRVRENLEYLEELQILAKKYNLNYITIDGDFKEKFEKGIFNYEISDDVNIIFLPNVNSSIKNLLMKKAQMLLYTPQFEHFGIVPVESMLNSTPPLVINNGGPTESVIDVTESGIDSGTGYIREPTEQSWADAMLEFSKLNEDLKNIIGSNGHKRAKAVFSRSQMSMALDKKLDQSISNPKNSNLGLSILRQWKLITGISIVIISYIIYRL